MYSVYQVDKEERLKNFDSKVEARLRGPKVDPNFA